MRGHATAGKNQREAAEAQGRHDAPGAGRRGGDEDAIGRSPRMRRKSTAPSPLRRQRLSGDFARVKVTKASTHDLWGKRIPGLTWRIVKSWW